MKCVPRATVLVPRLEKCMDCAVCACNVDYFMCLHNRFIFVLDFAGLFCAMGGRFGQSIGGRPRQTKQVASLVTREKLAAFHARLWDS